MRLMHITGTLHIERRPAQTPIVVRTCFLKVSWIGWRSASVGSRLLVPMQSDSGWSGAKGWVHRDAMAASW